MRKCWHCGDSPRVMLRCRICEVAIVCCRCMEKHRQQHKFYDDIFIDVDLSESTKDIEEGE